jgi:arylformamidase
MIRLIDISHQIKDGMVVYPNNAPVTVEPFAQIAQGASSNLSRIVLGTHTATHVDAPSHVFEGSGGLETIALERFIGACRVVDASHRGPGELVMIEDLGEVQAGERLLVRTSNSDRGMETFLEDFVALDGDAADFLAGKDIALFGIDYLSIKQRGSSDNRAHTALLAQGIPIVEGLNLKDVPAGRYELFCLPLKIAGVEGGPVRAILRTLE